MPARIPNAKPRMKPQGHDKLEYPSIGPTTMPAAPMTAKADPKPSFWCVSKLIRSTHTAPAAPGSAGGRGGGRYQGLTPSSRPDAKITDNPKSEHVLHVKLVAPDAVDHLFAKQARREPLGHSDYS